MSSFEHSQMKKHQQSTLGEGPAGLVVTTTEIKDTVITKSIFQKKAKFAAKIRVDIDWSFAASGPYQYHPRGHAGKDKSRGFMFYPMSSLCQRLYELAHACQLGRCMLPLSPIWKFYNFEKNILKAKRKKNNL